MQIQKIAAAHPKAVILREKDLPPETYTVLARQVLQICAEYDTTCILHSFPDSAIALGCDRIHLPLHTLAALPDDVKTRFRTIGASCHSPEDAVMAQQLGATYVTAGHVFTTECKKGLAPRGLTFLSETVRSVHIPVFAIGGIAPENMMSVRHAGAAGACVMSSLMQAEAPADLLAQFRKK